MVLMSDLVPFIPKLNDNYDLINLTLSTVMYIFLGCLAFRKNNHVISVFLFLFAAASACYAFLLFGLMTAWTG